VYSPSRGVRVTDFRTDPTSAVPPYAQLRAELRDRILDGRLPAGRRMPTVRAYAAELGIANNTVARAYRELEEQGFLETRGRLGTFVAAQGEPGVAQGQLAARAFVDRIRELGVAPHDALAWATRMFGED
jgi:DNA-binding transcriptional regulator YhcF (GntR family)